MKRISAYRFRLDPKQGQIRSLKRFAGSARFIYNHALARQKERHLLKEKNLSYYELSKELTALKKEKETSFLSEVPAQPLQQSLRNLDSAFRNFFSGRTRFPHFKKRGHDSFRYPQVKNQYLDLTNRRVFLPKLGWVRFRGKRKIEGKIKNFTVIQDGSWYIAITTEREVPEGIHRSTSSVGIDVGVVRFATLSDGTVYQSFKKETLEKSLILAQRGLSRKKKFQKNWRKQKTRINKISHRISSARRDFHHKISNTISKNHAMVVIEDLKVANMIKSAKGSVESPGKNVSAKSGLNRAILNQGWGSFRRMLEYKTKWNYGSLIAVNPSNTSRKCSRCGNISPDSRKSQAKFCCVSCGFAGNADLNAAINISRAGHAQKPVQTKMV